MHKKVSIIVLNYNGLKFNQDCLDSILKQSYRDFEILFVDNNSSDSSLQQVQTHYTKQIQEGSIKIIANKQNDGFAEGNNIWVTHASPESDYICLLNNDTIVDSNWLWELVTCIESNPELGAVWSLILDKWFEEQTKELFFKQKKVGVNNYIMEPVLRTISEKEIENGVIYTTGLGWCSLLYKKKLISKPFPSFYFAYGEDTYLSFCLILSGHKLAICTTSLVHHLGSGSFGKKVSLLKAFHGAKNQLINILLFHSTSNAIKLMPVYLLYQLVKIGSGSPFTRIKGLLKAIARCFGHNQEIQEQKQRIQAVKTIPYQDFTKQLSTKVFDNTYFLTMPRYQLRIMNSLNKICKLYFNLLSIK